MAAWVIYVLMYICLRFQSHRLNIRVRITLLSLKGKFGDFENIAQYVAYEEYIKNIYDICIESLR